MYDALRRIPSVHISPYLQTHLTGQTLANVESDPSLHCNERYASYHSKLALLCFEPTEWNNLTDTDARLHLEDVERRTSNNSRPWFIRCASYSTLKPGKCTIMYLLKCLSERKWINVVVYWDPLWPLPKETTLTTTKLRYHTVKYYC